MVTYWVVFCDIIHQVFPFFPEYVEMILSYSVSDPIKSHVYCSWPFCFQFRWIFCLPLCCPLPLTLVFLSGPFLIGPFSRVPLSDSVQISLPILIPWLMPCYLSLFCIINSLLRFPWALLVLVCWILVPVKNIHLIWFVSMVLRCSMHLNICR